MPNEALQYKVILSGIVVISFGVYLLSLFVITILKRQVAVSYFSSFASSAKAHYVEQALRLLVGTSLVSFSGSMLFSEYFRIFGWIIVVSTIVLIFTPWRWHNKLGERLIPLTIRNINVYAVSASVLGAFILYAAVCPLFC